MATHPVFLPGKSHGQRSLVGYSQRGCRVRHDLVTEQLQLHAETGTSLGISLGVFFVINFNWRLITLQYCGRFFPYIDVNHLRVYMCPPHPEHPLPPSSPLYPTPLGCPRTPVLSALLHELNLPWSSILHMVIYMFQCYSLKSSHP